MSLIHQLPTMKLFGLTMGGALMGLALAFTTAPAPLSAFAGCKCDDYGTGSYSCNSAQTGCTSGSEHCVINCVEE